MSQPFDYIAAAQLVVSVMTMTLVIVFTAMKYGPKYFDEETMRRVCE